MKRFGISAGKSWKSPEKKKIISRNRVGTCANVDPHMVFIMGKPCWAQKSNSGTPLRFWSGDVSRFSQRFMKFFLPKIWGGHFRPLLSLEVPWNKSQNADLSCHNQYWSHGSHSTTVLISLFPKFCSRLYEIYYIWIEYVLWILK